MGEKKEEILNIRLNIPEMSIHTTDILLHQLQNTEWNK